MPCYILTDKAKDRRYLQKVLVDSLFFETPHSLLHALGRTNHGQIIILDSSIRSFDEAGLQTAKIIRQHDPDSQLIMIAERATLAEKCFEAQIGLLDFIIKRDFSTSFFARLLRAISRAEQNLRQMHESRPIPIRLPDGANSRLFDLNKIIYLTTDSGSHHLFIHEENHVSRIRASMREIESCHKNLYRVHSSFMINVAFLHAYHADEHMLLLITGDRIPVSRHYAGRLREILRWPSENPRTSASLQKN